MRSTLPALLLSALLLAAPAAALRADSTRHPPPPAPNPELAALKDSIAALATGSIRDLGDAAVKTGARLDSLERELTRIGRNLDGTDLPQLGRDQAAVKSAVADLVGKSDVLGKQLQDVTDRLAANAAESARGSEALKRGLAAGDPRIGLLEQEERQWQDHWARELAARATAAAALQQENSDRFTGWIAGAAGVLACLTLGVGAAQHRARRRRQWELLRSIARLGMDFREARAPQWQAIEDRLQRLALQCEHSLQRAELRPRTPGLDGAPAGLAPSDGSRGALAAALRKQSGAADFPAATLSPSEKPTVSVSALPEPSVASRLLWPAEFLDPESPLSRWRFLLESHFGDDDHPALPVLAGLLGLRAAADRPAATAPEIAAAAFRLSEALHAYWRSLADLSAEDRQQASAAWIGSMRRIVAPAAPRLELREVMTGSRMDPDLMHATEERSGNHLNVAEVHSWAVVDRSGDRPKVLHRAQVAST